ncbi:hypothetical protein H4219_005454 [Mycoemilia scoparia]|uniref:PH domain-containing protein n=1 Tax=Mycoemilia scoparia TaxID=417184 RepID=A0A9W7ZP71_9FUNG|nr:hypothetical protein H4219_005454 [Mycoemilia scoparia]
MTTAPSAANKHAAVTTKLARKADGKMKRLSSIFRKRSTSSDSSAKSSIAKAAASSGETSAPEESKTVTTTTTPGDANGGAAAAPTVEPQGQHLNGNHQHLQEESSVEPSAGLTLASSDGPPKVAVSDLPDIPEEKTEDVAATSPKQESGSAAATTTNGYTTTEIEASRPRSASSSLVGSGQEGDLIIQRLQGWKHIIKNYASYFAAVRDVEKAALKAFKESGEQLVVPIKDDHYFATLGQGGVQDAASRLKQLHTTEGQHHQLVYQNITTQTLPRLNKLRDDVKHEVKEYRSHVVNLFNELQKCNKKVNAAYDVFTKAVEANESSRSSRTDDPFLTEFSVKSALVDRTKVEQALYKAIKARKDHLRAWEAELVEKLHEIINNYLGWKISNATNLSDCISRDQQYLNTFDNDSEWEPFAKKFAKVLDHPQGLQDRKSADEVEYPLKNHESTHLIIEGALERNTRSPIKHQKESYAVLTKLGYLHVFGSAEDISKVEPLLTLYIPECYLELPRDSTQFRITGATGSGSIGPFRRNNPLVFGATTENVANQWITAIRSLSKDPNEPKNSQRPPLTGVRTPTVIAKDDGGDASDDKKEEQQSVDEEGAAPKDNHQTKTATKDSGADEGEKKESNVDDEQQQTVSSTNEAPRDSNTIQSAEEPKKEKEENGGAETEKSASQ